MKKSKYQMLPYCLIVLFWGWANTLSAQQGLPILDFERSMSITKDLGLIPDAYPGKQYYFLPRELKVKRNQEGQYLFSLIKFVGEEGNVNLLNAQFTFEPHLVSSNKIQEALNNNFQDRYYAGAYPFYHHESFRGSFENIDLIVEVVDQGQREEIWRHKAALTTNGLVIGAKVPDSIATVLWEVLAEEKGRKIEFKIEVAIKSLEYPDNLKLRFNPIHLKKYLLDPQDSTQISKKVFDQQIISLLETQETSLLEVSGNVDLYEKEELLKMITNKIAGQLFKNQNEEATISSTSYSSTKKVTRRVYVNGKLVEEENTTNKDSASDNTPSAKLMKFKQAENLLNASVSYSLGRRTTEIRTYPLSFNLSGFYDLHTEHFKSN